MKIHRLNLISKVLPFDTSWMILQVEDAIFTCLYLNKKNARAFHHKDGSSIWTSSHHLLPPQLWSSRSFVREATNVLCSSVQICRICSIYIYICINICVYTLKTAFLLHIIDRFIFDKFRVTLFHMVFIRFLGLSQMMRLSQLLGA